LPVLAYADFVLDTIRIISNHLHCVLPRRVEGGAFALANFGEKKSKFSSILPLALACSIYNKQLSLQWGWNFRINSVELPEIVEKCPL
jgi:hypothetical protein